VLIHQSARLDDYDQQGKLNFNGNPIYRADKFNSQEITGINQALNISQTSTFQHYQKNQSVSEKIDISKTSNSNDSNLGTVVVVSSILLVASLGIYGIIKVKKTKKIKK
jgi:hypothetical protein